MESKQKIHKGLIAVPTITTYKQDYHQSKVPYWLSNISRDFLLQKKSQRFHTNANTDITQGKEDTQGRSNSKECVNLKV